MADDDSQLHTSFQVLDSASDDVSSNPLHKPPFDDLPISHPSYLTPLSSSSSSSTRSTRPAIPILTGLRGVLAVWILVHNHNTSDWPDALPMWTVTSGSAAVSAFFVLSGFIMVRCTHCRSHHHRHRHSAPAPLPSTLLPHRALPFTPLSSLCAYPLSHLCCQAYNYGDHAFNSGVCYFSFVGKRYGRMLPLYYLSQLMCVGTEVVRVREAGWDGVDVLHWLALASATNTWFPWPITPQHGFTRGSGLLNPTLWTLQTELAFYLAFPPVLRAVRWVLGVATISGLGRGRSADVDRRCRFLLALLALFSALSVIPILLQCYGPELDDAQAAAEGIRPGRCITSWVAILYVAPYCRVSEFVLGLLTAALYILSTEAQTEGGGGVGTDGGAHTPLVHFASTHWLLRSPVVLMAWMTGLALLLVFLPHPDLGLPPAAFGVNPGCFALGFALLLLPPRQLPTAPYHHHPSPPPRAADNLPTHSRLC